MKLHEIYLTEAPIRRSPDSYDPDPNRVYHGSTTDTTPKYDYDPEEDYSPGKSLGPIPNIQSQTEVVQMPNGTLYLFYVEDRSAPMPKPTFMQKIADILGIGTKMPQTGPNKVKNVVGFLKLKPFEDGYKVSGVGLDSSIQGQGKAIKLYMAFTAWKNKPIYSDYTQTPSAIRMWDSIIKRYPDRVVAFDQSTNKEIPLDKAGDMYQDEPEGFDDMSQMAATQTLSQTRLYKLLP